MAERLPSRVIRGGEVYVGGALVRAEVGIEDGVITEISSGRVDGETVIDATGCLVLPGGVDPHVHLSPAELKEGSYAWVDDFESGTRAAAAGGVTTVGNITFPRPGERLGAVCDRVSGQVAQQACTDVMLHPVVVEVQHLVDGELDDLARQGHFSLKVFTTSRGFLDHRGGYYRFMTDAARRGFVSLVHCEDEEIIEFCTEALVRDGKANYRHFAESRPESSEEAAVAQLIGFAEMSGTPIYVVHLSCARALERCSAAKARGVPIYVETRPLYLHLTDELFQTADGAKYIGCPPLRRGSDVAALWAGARSGLVDTIGTDHAPWTLGQKLTAGASIEELLSGVPDLETVRPMLFSEGVLTGRLSLSRFVDLTATNPARIFGAFPRKGVIAPGSDADLVVWDPELARVVDGSTAQSRAGYSPYDGRLVTGWPRQVLSRGLTVAEEGKVTGPHGHGQVVSRVAQTRARQAS